MASSFKSNKNGGMTPQMKVFIGINQTKKVVFGGRITENGKPVLTRADIAESNSVLYRLDDGSKFILTFKDIQSAPDYLPEWSYAD